MQFLRDTAAMYSWHTLRQVLLGILLLPLAHFVFLLASDYQDIVNPDPAVWESDVAAIELRYSQEPPGRSPLVVIGGRQVKLWRGLDNTLFPMPVVKAGVGSANLDDLLYHFDRLVPPWQPGAVLYVPGPGDFVVRDSKQPDEFMLMVKGFTGYLQQLDKPPQFYVLTLWKWPRYPELWNTVAVVNQSLEKWAAAEPRVTLLDARPLLQKAQGQPDPAFYRSDGVNLNDWGYTRLSLLLRTHMESDYPEFF